MGQRCLSGVGRLRLAVVARRSISLRSRSNQSGRKCVHPCRAGVRTPGAKAHPMWDESAVSAWFVSTDWPCNSNSVCLGSCRLPYPGARSTDCGLSAGILAAGPDHRAYSLLSLRGAFSPYTRGPRALRLCVPAAGAGLGKPRLPPGDQLGVNGRPGRHVCDVLRLLQRL
jgi:hypothetical protein